MIKNSGSRRKENIVNAEWKIVIGYRMLAGEFCVVNEDFSNLWCLMNTLSTAM